MATHKTVMVVRNDFHNSEASLRVVAGEIVSARRLRRLRDKLCGSRDCTCSGSTGARGPQPQCALVLDCDYHSDGSVRVITVEDRDR